MHKIKAAHNGLSIPGLIASGIIGFVIGAVIGEAEGAAICTVFSILFYCIRNLVVRTRTLEHELIKIRSDYAGQIQKETKTAESPQPDRDSTEEDNILSDLDIPDDEMVIDNPTEPGKQEQDTPTLDIPDIPTDVLAAMAREDNIDRTRVKAEQKPEHTTTNESSTGDRVTEFIKNFFTQGNVVVKVGVIVLFFGFGFLLKYASDHRMLPIELRLCFAALSGIALLIAGYRLRIKHRGYSRVIQGAGIGILYLTVFGAAKMYTLLPMNLAFIIMVGLVAFSGIIAVLQDAKSLAVFGIVGGFLAPVLMSTGTGSHVALFSYYALLNMGIFTIAWFKSWRLLNWLGFIFTFVIGSLWGYKYYQPEYFSTTEPFLILHFIFYSVISTLFAFKQPVKLKGYIDGTLVFGLPVITFGLQTALVKDFQFGMAFSALVFGGYYVLLCLIIWKQKAEGMKMLAESFLSLGIILLSLAIPFAFDSDWTSGIWAMEGAAILWIGIKQKRVLARLFGLLLQIAAALSFLHTVSGPVNDMPIVNGICLSCIFISIAGFLTNYFLNIYGWSEPVDNNTNKKVFLIPVIWALLWWFGGGIFEILNHADHSYWLQAIIGFISVSCLVMSLLSSKLEWQHIFYPAAILPFLLFALLVLILTTEMIQHPFKDYYWISFCAGILVSYVTIVQNRTFFSEKLTRLSHSFIFYTILVLITWETSWQIKEVTPFKSVWSAITWGVIPGIFALLMTKEKPLCFKQVRSFQNSITDDGLLPVIIWLGLWTLFMFGSNPGNPDPLPYLPVINPLSLSLFFSILMITRWTIDLMKNNNEQIQKTAQTIQYLCAILAFLWLNTIIARCLHHWVGVRYNLDSMIGSVYFQASISILWTIVALGSMVFASKKILRHVWFAGACLLGIVVFKLFLIDLAKIGTIARIVSFLVVGGLMLVIGYFSPLPPRQKEINA